MESPDQKTLDEAAAGGWAWDSATSRWVPSTPPPPAPPQPAETVDAAVEAETASEGAPAPPPAPAAVELPPTPSPAQVVPVSGPKVMDAEWPCAGYNGPQPWEAQNPPTLTQNHLMLSSGSAGPEVVELAALLAHLGFGTNISAGENPHAIFDTGVSGAVREFCSVYGVAEDPQVLQARTPDTVGPWIWEALTRAAFKKVAETTEG